MPRLTLRRLSKTYPGGIEAVKDLGLEVTAGELVSIVGPSGCGKSTTLRMIAGLEPPTAGDVLIDGASVLATPPHQRNLAMVFQESTLYPHLDVRGNLWHGLLKRGEPKTDAQERVEQAIAALGLEPLLDRSAHELSGGEAQRVALARAMARRPAVLVLDEPLSNLDASLRRRLRTDIKALHQQLNAATLHVTHDQTEAMSLADTLVVMRGGEVQQVGSPAEVYRRPANRFVAGFIGDPGMNLLEGYVSGGRFRTPDGELEIAADGVEDAPAVLGVRADDLIASHGDLPPVANAHVDTVEYLGHETLVHLVIGENRVVARWPADFEFAVRVPVSLRPESRRHYFSADAAGRRLN